MQTFDCDIKPERCELREGGYYDLAKLIVLLQFFLLGKNFQKDASALLIENKKEKGNMRETSPLRLGNNFNVVLHGTFFL